MPHSVAGSSSAGTGSTDNNSLEIELAMQENEDDVNIDELNALQRCWRNVHIPFEVQIVGLMTVPIICLCIFSIMIFVTTANRYNYVSEHSGLIDRVFECSKEAVNERFATNGFMTAVATSGRGSATARAAFDAMVTQRQIFDRACTLAATVAYKSSDPLVKNNYSTAVRDAMQENIVMRYRVDNNLVSLTTYRNAMTETIAVAELALGYLAQNSMLKDESLWLLQLRGARFIENYLTLMRGVGSSWLVALATRTTTDELEEEVNNVLSGFQQYVASMSDIVNDEAEVAYNQWLAYPDTATVISEAAKVVDGTSALTAAQWTAAATAALEELRELTPVVVNLLTEAKELNAQLVAEGLKLGGAVIASVLAAAYIVRAQVVSSRQVTDEVKESKKLHRAVTKFVPKSFLKLMGCTSVTHIVAGDQTEVAVAMLFADIHDFNMMAASMECEQLFDWLEVYFEQMSTITDRTNGFVDKFIGDALFCVYMNATEAVESAIEMTAMTDQLNGEIVCGGGSQIINIGIGIHHAIVSAGILGDSRRHTCTLVSSDVNLASRLEGLTKFYGSRIIASLSTVELCDRRTLAYRRLGLVRCKGRANGVEIADIFQTDPLDLKLFKRETMEEFHRAVDHQMAEELDEARKIFGTLHAEAEKRELVDLALDVKLAQRESVDQMLKK